jgi:hypothetical protein
MTTSRLALSLALALIFTCAALAQTAPVADPGAPPAPRLQSANGIEYINGGAGEEARAAIDAQRADFPLRLVFSVASGAYAVADRVDIRGADGKVLSVDAAGPMLLVKLRPGDYTVDATHGGKTEQRHVRVGREGTTVNWRWSEDVRR